MHGANGKEAKDIIKSTEFQGYSIYLVRGGNSALKNLIMRQGDDKGMKFDFDCDLLIGNRPENDSDEQCYECDDCHRYDICKKYYESRRIDRMSISEQIKGLRETAEAIDYRDGMESLSEIMYQAADTIKSLSAKLQAANEELEAEVEELKAANMEWPAGDCGGWIYCGDGKNFPEGENVKVIVSAVWDGYEYTTESYFYHGKFYNKPYYQISAGEICESYTGDKVVAWRSFPEPYHEP